MLDRFNAQLARIDRANKAQPQALPPFPGTGGMSGGFAAAIVQAAAIAVPHLMRLIPTAEVVCAVTPELRARLAGEVGTHAAGWRRHRVGRLQQPSDDNE